jgi:dihydroorotate dehydrogenase electron transfer subunit
VYLNDKTMLLPRPFGISDVETDGSGSACITLVYAIAGAGTAKLAAYEPGTEIEILGPQGNGYDLESKGRDTMLIGGGLGIPPLLFAARRIRETIPTGDGRKITALLGYRDAPYYANEIGKHCDEVFCISESAIPERTPLQCDGKDVSIGISESAISQSAPLPLSTDKNTIPINGTVMDLITHLTADGRLDPSNALVLSCGPTPMLKAVAEWSTAQNIPAQVSLEERMGCGYGACVGCTVEIKNTSDKQPTPLTSTNKNPIPNTTRKKICKEGPVFPADAVAWR